MNPLPLSHYAKAARADLPADAFRPVPSRLLWLALHVAIVVAGTIAIAKGVGGLWAALPISLLIGHSFAGCAFVGHELLHGSVVRGRRARLTIGWLCFLPFTLSPRLWVAWHNEVHHGNTMRVDIDPDAYPTLAQYQASGVTRLADRFALGHRRWGGIVTLLLGFTGQSSQMLLRFAGQRGWLDKSEHRFAIFETLLGIGVWTTVGFLVGWPGFLFAFVIPLIVANVVVMSYIVTNHSLSPLTEVNDPLLNSLSVTVPHFVEVLHLNFGYHVEHHLFPALSGRHAPAVRAALERRWPERYQNLPLLEALSRLAATPRVYADEMTLIDPLDGHTAPTLRPGAPAVVPAAPEPRAAQPSAVAYPASPVS
ncbi:MAG TPA: fatty acid desaturase [Polyangia bacterium]